MTDTFFFFSSSFPPIMIMTVDTGMWQCALEMHCDLGVGVGVGVLVLVLVVAVVGGDGVFVGWVGLFWWCVL